MELFILMSEFKKAIRVWNVKYLDILYDQIESKIKHYPKIIRHAIWKHLLKPRRVLQGINRRSI